MPNFGMASVCLCPHFGSLWHPRNPFKWEVSFFPYDIEDRPGMIWMPLALIIMMEAVAIMKAGCSDGGRGDQADSHCNYLRAKYKRLERDKERALNEGRSDDATNINNRMRVIWGEILRDCR